MDNSITRIAKVVDIKPETWEVKVETQMGVENLDDVKKAIETNLDNTEWALPALPKTIFTPPKVDELVLLITPAVGDNNIQGRKYYLGPIITQGNHLYEEPSTTGQASDPTSNIAPDKTMETIPKLRGVFPKKGAVAVKGRKNTELVLKDDEVALRTDFRHYSTAVDENGNHVSINPINPAYIILKGADGMKKDVGSTATIVADNINLIGNVGDGVADPTNNDHRDGNTDTVTTAKLEEIIEKAHALPFGEILVEFLEEFVKVFANHTHNFTNKEPDPTWPVQKLKEDVSTLKERMLSKNVRIN